MKSFDAVAIAARWSRRFLLRPDSFQHLVTATSSEVLEFTRVRWRGHRREVVARTEPTESRSRKLAEPLDPLGFDPWGEDRGALAAATRQLVQCPACAGEKKVTCADCRGTAVVACSACRSTGRVFNPRTRRMINCRSCRGEGRRRCSCRDGLARCPTCEGRGKVERWLEIHEQPFTRVTHTPPNLLADSLPASLAPESFDLPVSSLPVVPRDAWTGGPHDTPPRELAGLLAGPPIAPRLDSRRERIDEVALQTFGGRTSTIEYRLLGATGSVHVRHWDGHVAENAGSRAPFRRRRLVLGGVALACWLGGLALHLTYAGQHAYLAAGPNAAALFLLAFVLPLAALWPAAGLVLPGRRGRLGRLAAAAVPALAILAAQAAFAGSGYPSLDRARQLAARGEVDEALAEVAAAADLGRDAGSAAFHDELQLARALATVEPAEAWEASRSPFYTDAPRTAAQAHAVHLTAAAAEILQRQGAYGQSEGLLALVPTAHADDAAIRPLRVAAHLERAGACTRSLDARCTNQEIRRAREAGLDDEDLAPLYAGAVAAAAPALGSGWSAIRSRRSLDERLAACREIRTPFGFLQAIATPQAVYPVDRAAVDDLCRRLGEQYIEEEQRRRRREAQQREARQRAWARAPLLCRDGTLSPSCVCGQSSRRGCCSRHGGVDGCSQSYPR